MTTPRFRGEPRRRQELQGGSIDLRHRHRAGYFVIILEGELEEAGEEGRRRASPGDVLVHRPFDAHCDYIGARGAKVLNLPWLNGLNLSPMGRLGDVDAIMRLAEYDAFEASTAAVSAIVPRADRCRDWPDLLADHLRGPTGLALHEWADRRGLAPETVSRGFKKLYGVSPARFRLEYRARSAWRQIADTVCPFAQIVLDCGFADQAHMSRAVRAITGSAPSNWRARQSNSFKTRVNLLA